MLNFFVNLPREALYCPALECDVFDYVFRGLSQPLVGTFSIPIGEIKDKTKQKWDEDITMQIEIINLLRHHSSKSKTEIDAEIAKKDQLIKSKMRGKIGDKLK